MVGGVIGLKSWGVRFGGTLAERDQETKTFGKICASTRLLGKFSLAIGDKRTRQAFSKLVWDTPTDTSHSGTFKLRTDVYDGNNERVNRYELDLPHGLALNDDFVAGAIVDQVGKKIILPDGRWIDGPTGDIYNVHGDVLIHRDSKAEQQAKNKGDKEC